MKGILWAGILLALLLLPAWVGASTVTLGYGTHEIDITLDANQDMAYVIPLRPGDRLLVDLSVADGGPVDFYMSNQTAYELYSSGAIDSLYYVQEYSRTNAGYIQYTYNALVENDMVVLVDNTGRTQDGAVPAGPVVVQGQIIVQSSVWTWENIVITAVLVILIIAFMASFPFWNRRRPGRREKQ